MNVTVFFAGLALSASFDFHSKTVGLAVNVETTGTVSSSTVMNTAAVEAT